MTQSVIFATPTFPSFRGNGLAMRAAATLRLLSAWCDEVHLLIIPIYNLEVREPEAEIAQMCRSWHMVTNPDPSSSTDHLPEWRDALAGTNVVPQEWQHYNSAWQDKITASIRQCHSDLIFVFRFYLAPFIVNKIDPGIPIWLDVDEVESTARSRLAHIYAAAGKKQEAFDLRMEALAFEKFERHYLRLFERIFACSKVESECVLTRNPDAKVILLPNVYPSICPQKSRDSDGKARFLYVGTFGYYPNVDAVRYFLMEVLPLICARSALPIELDVVGSGLSPSKEQFSIPGVRIIGPVPETTPYYADCDLAIVPLRAAGGTRIKILEAFSHKRAVVSTSLGAEGLEVTNGVHLLIADGAEEFASHCLRMINNVDERESIATRGHEFFKEHHTTQMLLEKLPQIFGDRSLTK